MKGKVKQISIVWSSYFQKGDIINDPYNSKFLKSKKFSTINNFWIKQLKKQQSHTFIHKDSFYKYLFGYNTNGHLQDELQG